MYDLYKKLLEMTVTNNFDIVKIEIRVVLNACHNNY